MKFKFPDTGEGVTEGQFLEWKVDEGEVIEEDQVVGEAETDKAVVEIPAPADGTVEELKVSPGDNVKVGEVIMELDTGETSEEVEQKAEHEEDNESQAEEEDELEKNTEDQVENKNTEAGNVLALPKVRKLAEEKKVDLASIKTGERITKEEILEAADESKHQISESENQEGSEAPDEEQEESSINVSSDVDATPAVRKLAREKGINIGKIEGSGRGGKVTRQDVLNFEEDAEEAETEREHKTSETVSVEELSGLEKNIARKMQESKFSAPHVTHIEKADVTRLVEIREEADGEVEEHLTYMPFIMKACMLAAKKHPRANAHFDGDKMEIDLKDSFNFNIAVDTDRGLLVPRIDNIGDKNLLEIARELGDTVERAQNGEISSEEMAPGSFSITNIGVIGGEAFNPIINPPQTCILGVGKIQETAEVVDGEVVPRTTVKLSFSYDHRVLDGATAARFVNEVVENLENPEEMMVEI